MPIKNVTPLRQDSNDKILNAIRNQASLDYQTRIPDATKAGVRQTLQNLLDHRPAYNEFIDGLVNRIGRVVVRNMSWTNPLAEFKQGILQYGDSIEEINVGLLRAHTYDADRDYLERVLFGTETPEVQVNFHAVNRQEFYKITINEELLNRAFLEDGGLSKFISAMLEAPVTSDNWDEFMLTTSLFAEYERNGGFHHVNVPDVAALTSDEADAKGALRKMRAMADTLKFPSTRYNAARMPTFANADDLVLFVSPEFNAAIDVEALAGAFNVDRANMHGRIIPIPQERFNIQGAQAIMTTRDFFVIADKLLENRSQPNAASLGTNYFLHHHQVISASRFVPAVMFWTGASDDLIEIRTPVVSVAAPTFENVDGDTVTSGRRGAIYQAITEVVTEATADNPDDTTNTGVAWSVTGGTSPRTFITDTGVLHIGGSEKSASLTVKATSTWIDSENVRRDALSATATIGVTGDIRPEWPILGKIESISVQGVNVEGVEPGTTSYTIVADVPVDVDDVVVTMERGAEATVTVDAEGDLITITTASEASGGTVYTVTVTDAV